MYGGLLELWDLYIALFPGDCKQWIQMIKGKFMIKWQLYSRPFTLKEAASFILNTGVKETM